MALQISEKNGTFYLSGKINCSTVRSFIIYFEYYIIQSDNIIIDINEVNEIERVGLSAIKTLMSIALKNNKMFSVVGYGCKDIYDHFNTLDVA